MTERLNSWQAIHSKWREIVPEEHATAESEFTRGLEEIEELREAIKEDDGTLEKGYAVADEATDVIIRMLGVIDARGFDVENLMERKFDTIYKKYNPTQHRELREGGMSFVDAMKHQKKTWSAQDSKTQYQNRRFMQRNPRNGK